jgi:hypothetical protein
MDIEREFRLKKAGVFAQTTSREELEEEYIEQIKCTLELKSQVGLLKSELERKNGVLTEMHLENHNLRVEARTFNQKIVIRLCWVFLISWGFFAYLGYDIGNKNYIPTLSQIQNICK